MIATRVVLLLLGVLALFAAAENNAAVQEARELEVSIEVPAVPANVTADGTSSSLRGRKMLSTRMCVGSTCSYNRQCCSNSCVSKKCKTQFTTSGGECCLRNDFNPMKYGLHNADCPNSNSWCISQTTQKFTGIQYGDYSSEQLPSDGMCS